MTPTTLAAAMHRAGVGQHHDMTGSPYPYRNHDEEAEAIMAELPKDGLVAVRLGTGGVFANGTTNHPPIDFDADTPPVDAQPVEPLERDRIAEAWEAWAADVSQAHYREHGEGCDCLIAVAINSDQRPALDATRAGDGLDVAWEEARALPEAKGRPVTITRGGPGHWFANIGHETKGYTVWYMPGDSPAHALRELIRALNANRAALAVEGSER